MEILEILRKYLNVRYVYEEGSTITGGGQMAEDREVRMPEDIAAIPVELLETLEEAIEIVDMEMMNAVIAQIRAYNFPLADALLQLMNNFDYDEILALIQGSE